LFNDIEEKIHIPYAELTHSRAIIWVRVKTPFVTAPGLQILAIFTPTPNILDDYCFDARCAKADRVIPIGDVLPCR